MEKDYKELSKKINKAYTIESEFLLKEVMDEGAGSNLDETVKNQKDRYSEDEIIANQKGSQRGEE